MISSSETPQILGIGDALVDLLLHVDDDFLTPYLKESRTSKGGQKILSEEEMLALYQQINQRMNQLPLIVPGGSSANTLAGLSQLGIKTRMIGKIGEDLHGKQFTLNLASQGVDTSKIKVTNLVSTGSCLCMVSQDSERTMRTFLGAAGLLSAKDITEDDFVKGSIVKLEGYSLKTKDLIKHCFELAKLKECKVLFDLSSFEIAHKFRTKILALFQEYHPMILANEEEAKCLTQCQTAEEALYFLQDYGSLVVITLGHRGALLATDGEKVYIPARPVDKIIDTTGAGDLFSTGLLYGIINGWSLVESGQLACAIAAIVIQQYGARIPDEIWEELRLEFLI